MEIRLDMRKKIKKEIRPDPCKKLEIRPDPCKIKLEIILDLWKLTSDSGKKQKTKNKNKTGIILNMCKNSGTDTWSVQETSHPQ